MKIALELGEELRCLLEEGEKHQTYSTHSRTGEIERNHLRKKIETGVMPIKEKIERKNILFTEQISLGTLEVTP